LLEGRKQGKESGIIALQIEQGGQGAAHRAIAFENPGSISFGMDKL